MRKIFFLTILAAVFVIAGCKKETILDTITGSNSGNPLKSAMSNELEMLYKELSPVDFGNIRVVNGDILKFDSEEHYDQVYESLNALYEAWTILFLETYDTGDEDELDEIIETLGFDDRTPLIKFEQKYKKTLQTLQEMNARIEQTWLADGARGNSPSDEITACHIEQTLLSLYYEFCIGDTICQIRPGGYEILIPTSELRFINEIRNTSISELLTRGPTVPDENPWGYVFITNPPVIIIPPKSGTCHENRHRNSDWEPRGNYKFEWSYHFRPTWPRKKKTTATIKNYKWKAKKNKWVKDDGSFCWIGFDTQLYNSYTTTSECIKSSLLIKLSPNTKAFSKSTSKKTNAVLSTSVHGKDGVVTCNPNESLIRCRHRGVNFNYNVATGNLQ